MRFILYLLASLESFLSESWLAACGMGWMGWDGMDGMGWDGWDGMGGMGWDGWDGSVSARCSPFKHLFASLQFAPLSL